MHIKTKLLLTIVAVFISISLCFSAKFKSIQSNEGVEFSYKWKNSKFFDKTSPLVLVVKVKNSNNYAVEVTYTVDYFWQGITKASSDEKVVCVKQKKAIVLDGRKQGFDTGNFTNDEILSENFIMELNGIKVEKTDLCKKQ